MPTRLADTRRRGRSRRRAVRSAHRKVVDVDADHVTDRHATDLDRSGHDVWSLVLEDALMAHGVDRDHLAGITENTNGVSRLGNQPHDAVSGVVAS